MDSVNSLVAVQFNKASKLLWLKIFFLQLAVCRKRKIVLNPAEYTHVALLSL